MMMKLSHYNLKNISPDHISLPEEDVFGLPEKVLQFGTGMLLRGLPDYFIDKANRQGIFNGRIVVVKSTSRGETDLFDKQDGLYTICERGIENGVKIETNTVSSAISRVLNASQDWEEILKCAYNPSLKIIVSNTTEVGIQLVDDDIGRYPPVSFPGKLLAFLKERFKAFGGAKDSGFVIVPTELLPENGEKLEAIVLELAHLNGLDDQFIEWLEGANYFCNSLVDRIVTGMPPEELKQGFFEDLGYQDDLLIVTEVYRLWAIEGDEHVRDILSFQAADEGIKIEPDIQIYRELKLRLLNATHTFLSGLAFLADVPTVKEAMENTDIQSFIIKLTFGEIGPSIPYRIAEDVKAAFTRDVLDRFRNPHIEHHWKTIAQNYSRKMKLRCIPLLLHHYENNDSVPSAMAFGFAAYIYYMKAVKIEGQKHWGRVMDEYYLIDDELAAVYYQLWQEEDMDGVVHGTLGNTAFWGHNLLALGGFSSAVLSNLKLISEEGMANAVRRFDKE